GDRAVGWRVHRIVRRAVVGQLVRLGNHLAPERVAPLLDERHPHRGDANRVLHHHVGDGVRVHVEMLGQLLGFGDALRQGLSPGFHKGSTSQVMGSGGAPLAGPPPAIIYERAAFEPYVVSKWDKMSCVSLSTVSPSLSTGT